MEHVRKAVIPAAGLGTRFLPATKAIPKEMLPIVDKPTIQYVVEEAVQSGLENVIFVTSTGKNSIEDHFDYDFGLEAALREKGKDDLLEIVDKISRLISISSVRQKKPLGLGHAVLVAEHMVGNEPFAVFLGDDVIDSRKPAMKQLMEVYEERQASVIAVMEVPPDAVSRYGIVSVESVPDSSDDRLFRIKDMIEKPSLEEAPSNLAIIGRYLLTPAIFEEIRNTDPGALGEIQLTDGIRNLMKKEPVFAYRFEGTRYDAGNKLEYLIASVEFGLKHPEVGAEFRKHLEQYLRKSVQFS